MSHTPAARFEGFRRGWLCPFFPFNIFNVIHLQGSEHVPDIVVTSYHMLQNLSCEACKTGKLENCLGAQVCECSPARACPELEVRPLCESTAASN